MSLQYIAYTRLKTALFSQEILPGQFLSMQELCQLLGISISPLRSAIGQLQAEGLVEILPKKGVRIVNVDPSLIKGAFQVRRFLEVQACRELERHGRWDALHELLDKTSSIMERIKVGFDEKLAEDSYDVDMLLHDGVIERMDNDHLRLIHRQLSDKIRMIRLNGKYTPERSPFAMEEHLAVIEALIAGDYDTAATSLDRHLRISEARALGKRPDLVHQ
jgi:DNA-binding GntR family transcriptional regulator